MNFALSVFSLLLTIVCGQRSPDEFETFPSNYLKQSKAKIYDDTDLVLAFVVFRHGDRTPDEPELDLYPSQKAKERILFPYGPKALTNRGKQRCFTVGKYLRRRYDGLINRLYISEEIAVWTTDFDRTKMSALTAMAGLYPPPPAQRWNPMLDWQPVPYRTIPYDEDDLLYWYNCPRYLWLRDLMYRKPEVKNVIDSYQKLFDFLTERTQAKITTPEDVFFLNNLFQSLRNVDVQLPKWVYEASEEIKGLTKLEYEIEFYNKEMILLATGVLMGEIRNVTTEFVNGRVDGPKLRVYSSHENNVAAIMAAVGVFEAHQPPYGATFSLELRRKRSTGEYGIVAVYALDPLVNGRPLKMRDCEDKLFCDFNTFLKITEPYAWTKTDYKKNCPIKH